MDFAHGALATVAAYAFYVLHVEQELAWPIAAAVCVLVVGAVCGLVLERVARGLSGAALVRTENPNLDGSLVSGNHALYVDESGPGIRTFLGAVDKYLSDLRDSPQFGYPLVCSWADGQLFKAAGEEAKLTPSSTSADVTKGLWGSRTRRSMASPRRSTS